jgi:hypothetical protein
MNGYKTRDIKEEDYKRFLGLLHKNTISSIFGTGVFHRLATAGSF